MLVNDKALQHVMRVVGEAGLTCRQAEVMRRHVMGQSQQVISLALGVSQPAIYRLLGRGRAAMLRYATSRFGSRLAWYRWLWHVIQGDIEGAEGQWRGATVGPPSRLEPLVDERGNPIRLRVLVFRPEDMVDA